MLTERESMLSLSKIEKSYQDQILSMIDLNDRIELSLFLGQSANIDQRQRDTMQVETSHLHIDPLQLSSWSTSLLT